MEKQELEKEEAVEEEEDAEEELEDVADAEEEEDDGVTQGTAMPRSCRRP